MRLKRWKEAGHEGEMPEQEYVRAGRRHYGRPIGGLYNQYKAGALRRGYDFTLTYEELESICSRACSYCGQQPKKRAAARIPVNGIDRVDNSAGYTLENCVPCCGSCNHIKGTMSVDEFLETLHRICDHMSKAAKPAD